MKGISPKMIAEKGDGIGRMVFNNPERRNALSLDMWEAVPVILDDFEADPAVRVIVMQGAGDKAFISGADISQFEQQRASAADVARYEEIVEAAQGRLQNCPKPTIAMIRGYCLGGGVGVALCADLRIAADDARFAIPAARLGLGYRHGGIAKLMRLVGPSFAKEIFFTARQFTAEEALAMGLVNRVVPADDLAATVADYAGRIAENAPLTIHSVKRIVRELSRDDGGLDRELCERLVKECFESDDYVEGRRAFMEKRKPRFRGR